MLGYDLYSSAIADILSEPSLSMPITVGLYAKWGSGKSFLLSKLRGNSISFLLSRRKKTLIITILDEMKNFARDWIDPVFQFSSLLFAVILHFSVVVGVIVGLSAQNWIIGIAVGVALLCICYLFLALVWYANKR